MESLEQQPARPKTHTGDASSVSAILRQQILAGEFRLDERLPAERTLAVTFGCSRGTVRAAMERLEELKLIERRIGSGTYVSYRMVADDTDIANITSPLELIDVRLGLEPQIARLAVIHASAIDLRKLENALITLENVPAGDPETFTEADQQFHLILAECTGNTLMRWLYGHINDVRSHPQWSAMKDKILKPERIEKYNRQHRQMYEAIVARQVEVAANVVVAHLKLARDDLIGASS